MAEKISPGMQQYLAIKENYPDAFLLFRMGDFYELFYEDAVKAGQLLELTVTSRNKNAENPIPMAGVPHHSAQVYIDSLVEMGYKVAIAEQMEDPKLTKGVVKREVVQVITPGTKFSLNNLTNENNYLTAVQPFSDGNYGFAYCDLSTGEMKVTVLEDEEEVVNEAAALSTKEVVVPHSLDEGLAEELKRRLQVVFSEQKQLSEEPEVLEKLADLVEEKEKETANRLLSYIYSTQMRTLHHIENVIPYQAKNYLSMDHFSKYNLELTRAIRNGKKAGTLYWLLDETKTAMGSRLLKSWITRPLLSVEKIEYRQTLVASLLDNFFERMEIQESLKRVYDLERLAARVSFGHVNAKDLNQLKNSLLELPRIHSILDSINDGSWNELLFQMDDCDDLVQLIDQAILEDVGMSVTEGGIIRSSYNSTLESYRVAEKDGAKWILAIEEKEKEATGIKTLR
ncbi:MAG: DNA mismatch repair protein MutS, partial [Streptococcaceae bacterium]|nr:DNA mismatch repair protein MutS [Streptococcaceae bacterium]